MNISGKYLKVWEVKDENGWIKVNLGDSRKLKDGSYQNFTWWDCSLVGNAKNVLLEKGDTVEVKSGIIYQEKYNDKYYNRITIFEIEVTKKADQQPQQNSSQNNQTFEDTIPF